jgi:hypothetical protein
LIAKQEVVLPWPIAFTSAAEPRRTAILKAFQTICCLPNKQYGIMLRRQDPALVLTALCVSLT